MKHVVLSIIGLALLAWNIAARAQADAELWPLWQRSDELRTTPIDHSSWQRFLDQYLQADPSGVNRVRYRDVTNSDQANLRGYLQALQAIDPRDFAQQEQFAYWINLYNAATIDLVLRNPGKSSILRMGERFFSLGPWNDELLQVAGVDLTLNDVEHRILRPIWRDRRIHFALNCASVGCPNLAASAFTRDNIEQLLNTNESAYINDPRGVRFTPNGRLEVSKVFDWYRVDFAPSEAALIEYFASHAAGALAAQLQAYRGRIHYEYDWTLNAP